MALSELIDALRGRREARTAGFHETARRLAAGESLKPEHVERVLDASGRSAEQLAAEVERLERRIRLRGEIAEIVRCEGERPEVLERIQRADDVLAKARAAHAQAVGPLLARLRVLNSAQDRISSLETELRSSAAPELQERAREAAAVHQQANQATLAALSHLSAMESAASFGRAAAGAVERARAAVQTAEAAEHVAARASGAAEAELLAG
ncbi:MAG: hypothetical protein IT348_19425 [Candidatus Eisenbacteria bacterium]|nr:hypothetical protein [Candidatus Eisenbacteria bacterium]